MIGSPNSPFSIIFDPSSCAISFSLSLLEQQNGPNNNLFPHNGFREFIFLAFLLSLMAERLRSRVRCVWSQLPAATSDDLTLATARPPAVAIISAVSSSVSRRLYADGLAWLLTGNTARLLSVYRSTKSPNTTPYRGLIRKESPYLALRTSCQCGQSVRRLVFSEAARSGRGGYSRLAKPRASTPDHEPSVLGSPQRRK